MLLCTQALRKREVRHVLKWAHVYLHWLQCNPLFFHFSPRWDRSHANPVPHLKLLPSPHWRCCEWWAPVLSCMGGRCLFMCLPKLGAGKREMQIWMNLKDMWAVLSSLFSETCWTHSTEQFHVSMLSEHLAFWVHSGQMENWHNLEQCYKLKSL